jgi:hypothetical protein
MNEFIKQVIEERFASKKQARYFYAKAGDKSLPKKERKKWSKWAKEFSDKTDFEELPDKVDEKEMDEVVDKQGNFIKGRIPLNYDVSGVSSDSMTDDVVATSGGQMGTHGVHGTHTSLRYWAEADMSKNLGYEDTLGDDESFKKAYNHFTKELKLSDEEAMERLKEMGYDPKLKGDKIRLIEDDKKFIEEFIDSILSKKNSSNDLVKKQNDEDFEDNQEINPIIKRQLDSLKDSLKSNNLSVDDVMKYLKDNE